MFGRSAKTLALCAALGACAAAWADPPYEILDPGVSDVSGASAQMRELTFVDLSPNGFSRSYKVPGRADLVMRTNGALYAISDNSVYVRDKKIKRAVVWRSMVPAATVFYIGRPNFNAIRSTGIRAVDRRVNGKPEGLRPSTALESVGGVNHVEVESLAERYELGPRARLELRIVGAAPEDPKLVSEDISYPTVRRTAPSAEEAAQQEAERAEATAFDAPPRPDRAHLSDRIDQMVRRAAKGT